MRARPGCGRPRASPQDPAPLEPPGAAQRREDTDDPLLQGSAPVGLEEAPRRQIEPSPGSVCNPAPRGGGGANTKTDRQARSDKETGTEASGIPLTRARRPGLRTCARSTRLRPSAAATAPAAAIKAGPRA